MRSKELPIDLRDMIVSKHRSGEDYKAVLLYWRYRSIASIILKGRSLKQLGLFSCLLAKLSNWWRRVLVRVMTKKLMVTLVALYHDHMEMGEIYRRTNITVTLLLSNFSGRLSSVETEKPTWNLKEEEEKNKT